MLKRLVIAALSVALLASAGCSAGSSDDPVARIELMASVGDPESGYTHWLPLAGGKITITQADGTIHAGETDDLGRAEIPLDPGYQGKIHAYVTHVLLQEPIASELDVSAETEEISISITAPGQYHLVWKSDEP